MDKNAENIKKIQEEKQLVEKPVVPKLNFDKKKDRKRKDSHFSRFLQQQEAIKRQNSNPRKEQPVLFEDGKFFEPLGSLNISLTSRS